MRLIFCYNSPYEREATWTGKGTLLAKYLVDFIDEQKAGSYPAWPHFR